ncbi:MAG TPA: polysaccharide biosynthesis/export family protein [Gemmatimonadales bacterium]|nr:polysaccharide biosynthesis/export family protein [Gemmatimonadales bacterium]
MREPSRPSVRLHAPTVIAIMLGLGLIVGAAACSGGKRPPETTPKPQNKDTAPTAPRAMATRAELEAVAAGKSGSVSSEEIKVVRDRLAHGDLQPGDRIAMRVLGEQTLTDTFTVKPTRTILLPNLGEVSLDGVLRSELNDHLKKEIGRFVRNPQVDATALVRVSLSGAVGRPGFYAMPADVVVSDALMAAGGPGARGDPRKTEIRRGGLVVASKAQMAQAIQQGASLDQLNVQSGDEIVVGQLGTGARGVLQTMGLISGALFGIVAISRLF